MTQTNYKVLYTHLTLNGVPINTAYPWTNNGPYDEGQFVMVDDENAPTGTLYQLTRLPGTTDYSWIRQACPPRQTRRIFMSPTGSDANDGSAPVLGEGLAGPVHSLQRAADLMRCYDGDIIVAPGFYDEQNDTHMEGGDHQWRILCGVLDEDGNLTQSFTPVGGTVPAVGGVGSTGYEIHGYPLAMVPNALKGKFVLFESTPSYPGGSLRQIRSNTAGVITLLTYNNDVEGTAYTIVDPGAEFYMKKAARPRGSNLWFTGDDSGLDRTTLNEPNCQRRHRCLVFGIKFTCPVAPIGRCLTVTNGAGVYFCGVVGDEETCYVQVSQGGLLYGGLQPDFMGQFGGTMLQGLGFGTGVIQGLGYAACGFNWDCGAVSPGYFDTQFSVVGAGSRIFGFIMISNCHAIAANYGGRLTFISSQLDNVSGVRSEEAGSLVEFYGEDGGFGSLCQFRRTVGTPDTEIPEVYGIMGAVMTRRGGRAVIGQMAIASTVANTGAAFDCDYGQMDLCDNRYPTETRITAAGYNIGLRVRGGGRVDSRSGFTAANFGLPPVEIRMGIEGVTDDFLFATLTANTCLVPATKPSGEVIAVTRP